MHKVSYYSRFGKKYDIFFSPACTFEYIYPTPKPSTLNPMKKFYFTISIDGIAAAVKARQKGRLSTIITAVRKALQEHCSETDYIINCKIRKLGDVRFANLCFELPDRPEGWTWLAHDTACAVAARTMGASDPFWLEVYKSFNKNPLSNGF